LSISAFLTRIRKSIFELNSNVPEGHCYLIQIDQKYLKLLPSFDSILSHDERQHSLKLTNSSKRFEYIFSRVVLKTILESYLESEIHIILDGAGKPHLTDSAISFNLSHSNRWLLIGVSNEHPIGVDIEEILEISEQESIEKIFLNQIYTDSLFKLTSDYADNLINFYSRWTAIEAFCKATGDGIASEALLKLSSEKVNTSLFQKKLDDSYFMSALVLSEGVRFKYAVID
jgi:4'-phosphopantetheinyl transferase